MNSAQSLRNFVSFFPLVFCINTCKTLTSLRTHHRFSHLKYLLLFIGTSQGNLRFVCSFVLFILHEKDFCFSPCSFTEREPRIWLWTTAQERAAANWHLISHVPLPRAQPALYCLCVSLLYCIQYF